MMLLKELLHNARWRIFLAVLSSALSAATSIGLIGYINRCLEQGLDDLGRGLLLFGGLLVLLFISGVVSQWLLVQIGHRLVYQLRLRLDPALGLVPEISGNRLMVSVRLMRQESADRLLASNDSAQFELTLCS